MNLDIKEAPEMSLEECQREFLSAMQEYESMRRAVVRIDVQSAPREKVASMSVGLIITASRLAYLSERIEVLGGLVA